MPSCVFFSNVLLIKNLQSFEEMVGGKKQKTKKPAISRDASTRVVSAPNFEAWSRQLASQPVI